jgi:hypothetical protein
MLIINKMEELSTARRQGQGRGTGKVSSLVETSVHFEAEMAGKGCQCDLGGGVWVN